MQRYYGRRFRITKVWAKNFRSIANASVELDDLTVLVGLNASGKSNVLDVLRFVKDALNFDLEAAISMRQGIRAIRRRTHGGRPPNIEIVIHADVRDYSIEYGFTIGSVKAEEYKVKREYGKIWNEDDVHPVEFRIEDGALISSEFLMSGRLRSRRMLEEEETVDLQLRNMLRPWILRDDDETEEKERISAMIRALRFFLSGMAYMRFYHIFPNTIREPQKLEGARPLDEDAGNLASVLREMNGRSNNRMPLLREAIFRLIPGISDLEVIAAGGYLVVRLKHDTARGGTWFDLAQESDGTVRMLALLVALYQTGNVPLVSIEEPELTVHPGALAVLADVLNEASESSQIVVTTHSPDLIDRVTNSRHVEILRVVELINNFTTVNEVPSGQVEAVKQYLFSPGELHRMGELVISAPS